MARRPLDETVNATAAAAAAMAAKAASDTTAAVMGNDIAYIKRDIADIKASFSDLTAKYVLKTELDQVTKESNTTHEDHETRIRSLEKTQTQTLTWGTVGILAIGIVEFLIIHFVK